MQFIRNGSFNQKKLRLTLLLGATSQQGFDDKGNNTVIVEGLRVSAQIRNGGGIIAPTTQIVVYGLSAEIMNQVARIKWNTEETKMNFIRLEALHNGAYTLVFEGMISFAYPNFGASSESMLTIQAVTAIQHQIQAAPPVSIKGEVDVAKLIEQICQNIGMDFENNGVTTKISNPYLCETGLEQIKKLCQAADINLAIEARKVAISNKTKGRNIKIPVISPNTGLIGYPVPNLSGITFQCLFDPMIRFHGIVQIKDSLISVANGMWLIYGLTYHLESEVANGKWCIDVSATYIGEVKVAK
ncbi:hypothetical protein EV694_1682 [Volucribacter psittacicida]|uniref:Uncharacterized protein n=1 Tax=Volucribacter psittacicida TaxID=203482 RepID=A0A4R1FXV7_9PAST|nr:hypothetical protein [Volucribacter psittacicida]TCJ96131.1 hypothetical protein EV694_1682 [Volucribacter psittacicida]